MDENEAREEIRSIRVAIERSKARTVEGGHLFFFWGLWIVLAIIGMYALVILGKHNWISLNWVVFVGLGWIYTVIYSLKKAKTDLPETYPQTAARYLSIACGIAFVLVGLILPLIKLYSYGVIPVLIAVIGGVFIYGHGGIYEWDLLKACGTLWWFSSIGMTFVHPDYRTLVFIPLILLGYIMPGWVLRRKYRKVRTQK
jgi:hypothetical protein